MPSAALAFISIWCASLVGQETPSGNSQRPVFTMSISLKQSTIAPGSEVAIDVELTNVSHKDIQIVRVSGPPLYTFKVLDKDSETAPLTPRVKQLLTGGLAGRERMVRCAALREAVLLHSALLLEAKAEMSSCYRRTFDLSEPNQYTVQLERIDPYTSLLVKSNTIPLTIAKPK